MLKRSLYLALWLSTLFFSPLRLTRGVDEVHPVSFARFCVCLKMLFRFPSPRTFRLHTHFVQVSAGLFLRAAVQGAIAPYSRHASEVKVVEFHPISAIRGFYPPFAFFVSYRSCLPSTQILYRKKMCDGLNYSPVLRGCKVCSFFLVDSVRRLSFPDLH